MRWCEQEQKWLPAGTPLEEEEYDSLYELFGIRSKDFLSGKVKGHITTVSIGPALIKEEEE